MEKINLVGGSQKNENKGSKTIAALYGFFKAVVWMKESILTKRRYPNFVFWKDEEKHSVGRFVWIRFIKLWKEEQPTWGFGPR